MPGKRGRPEGTNSTREAILDVAEAQFATNGYAATATRNIARLAGVNQGLINYYFGSKQALFDTVYKRRGNEISERRMRALDALEAASNGSKPDVRAIILAFLRPQFDLKRLHPNWSRLQARVHNEPEGEAFRIRRDVYDDVTRRYIRALAAALPAADPADIYWRTTFMIGTYLYIVSDVARLEEVSDGQYNLNDIDETIERLASFLVGGMAAPGTYGPHPHDPKARQPTGETGSD